MKTPYVVFNLIITHQCIVCMWELSGSMNSEMNKLPLYNLKCIPISIEVTHSTTSIVFVLGKYTFVEYYGYDLFQFKFHLYMNALKVNIYLLRVLYLYMNSPFNNCNKKFVGWRRTSIQGDQAAASLILPIQKKNIGLVTAIYVHTSMTKHNDNYPMPCWT